MAGLRLFGLIQLVQRNLLGDGVVDDGVREVEGLVEGVGYNGNDANILSVCSLDCRSINNIIVIYVYSLIHIHIAEAFIHMDDFRI